MNRRKNAHKHIHRSNVVTTMPRSWQQGSTKYCTCIDISKHEFSSMNIISSKEETKSNIKNTVKLLLTVKLSQYIFVGIFPINGNHSQYYKYIQHITAIKPIIYLSISTKTNRYPH